MILYKRLFYTQFCFHFETHGHGLISIRIPFYRRRTDTSGGRRILFRMVNVAKILVDFLRNL